VKRKFRLTSSTDFQRVRRLGKSYAHPLIVLVALPSESSSLRIGIAAGRSVGNAVQRNQAKRRMRSAIQPWLEKLPPGWDLVLIARQPILAAPYDQLCVALRGLLRRARLVLSEPDEPNAS